MILREYINFFIEIVATNKKNCGSQNKNYIFILSKMIKRIREREEKNPNPRRFGFTIFNWRRFYVRLQRLAYDLPFLLAAYGLSPKDSL